MCVIEIALSVTCRAGEAVKKPTPMQRQYLQLKKQYPDCIMMFRLGDFYEMFNEDAKTASPVLDIILTARQTEQGIEIFVPKTYQQELDTIIVLQLDGKVDSG